MPLKNIYQKSWHLSYQLIIMNDMIGLQILVCNMQLV